MAATKAQRIGIWIIAAFMAIGTIGSFMIIVLANSNGANDKAKVNELTAKYEADQKAYQAKADAQAKQLSDQYYGTFNQYGSRPAAFDAASVTELKTEDLIVGTGETLTATSTFTAYYIGWRPDGTVFDQSIADGALKAPFTVTEGAGVIEGWPKGVEGMKVGGIRELSIPSSLAYGETGSGENIPPNTPIKFIIMVIPTPETIEQPAMPQQLMNYYNTGRLQ